MKRYFFSFWLLLAIGTTAVYANRGIGEATRTTDPGVVIDGIRWATRNVDASGTFAENPESSGMFYQWNRRVGWSATGDVSGWNRSRPQGEIWERANNPCPQGWRVPVRAELQTLGDTDNVTSQWTSVNGINGSKFTDRATGNYIFLPAVGWRFIPNGTLNNAGRNGSYWSSTSDGTMYAWNLTFSGSVAIVRSGNFSRADGFSVRCVAE